MRNEFPIYQDIFLAASAEVAANPVKIDLTSYSWSELNFEAELVQSTSGHSGRSIAIYYAFSKEDLDPTSAVSLLSPSKRAFSVSLTGEAGVERTFHSGPVSILGNYLYVWIQHGSLGGNAYLSLSAVETGLSNWLSPNEDGVTSYPVVANSNAESVVVGSSESFVLAPPNDSRLGLTLYNAADKNIYISYAATVSSTQFKVRIRPNIYWEMPLPIWCGAVYAVGESAISGNILVDDLSSVTTTTTSTTTTTTEETTTTTTTE